MDKKFSVLMSLYKNDKPKWFELAVNSIFEQTLVPDEVILIVDGPILEELENTLQKTCKKYKQIKLFRNEQNLGLGLTLQRGVLLCSNEIIARMDSDDICVNTRFEKQFDLLTKGDCDLVASSVYEFIDDIKNIVSFKKVLTNNDEIVKYAKTRNPICHMSVMTKKTAVLNAGNYQDMYYVEDYYLWVRMMQKGSRFANIEQPLVYARVDENMYARRGGLKYYKSQKKLFKYMLKTKFINWLTYTKSKIIRFTVQVIMPNKMRKWFYQKKLRKKLKN